MERCIEGRGAEIGKVRRRFRPLGSSQEEYRVDGYTIEMARTHTHTHTLTHNKRRGKKKKKKEPTFFFVRERIDG
jgi:hypothetical protein